MLTPAQKRPLCGKCLRPLRNCLCHLVRDIENRIELLILQDKNEATNVKNTAGLLQLSLKNCERHVCAADERIPLSALEKMLYADGKQPLLLYPPTHDALALGLEMPATIPEGEDISPDKLRLVVIDATWRKSRKMLYLNPSLQRLPRLTLENPPASLYLVRKADSENQLSTLEASCYALHQLEQGCVDYAPLLGSLQGFVAQLLAFRPD
jgi:DTW domain-containing protein YfiP